MMKDVALELCEGRLVLCHEGGHSPIYVPFCGLAVLEALSGIGSRVEDPLLDTYAKLGGQRLQPHQEEVIAEAARNISTLS
jgi:hypothetical protein